MLIKTARSSKSNGQGFTLVELLVVLTIIAVLAAVVVLIINPVELTKRSRDAARLSDMSNLQSAINVAVQESTNSGTASILCAGTGGATPCQGNSNTGTRVVDGTGWIKVNLSSSNAVSLATLPVDPINDSTYNYTYYSDGTNWEIDCKLESVQQSGKMANDGGDNPNLYEVGSSLTLMH